MFLRRRIACWIRFWIPVLAVLCFVAPAPAQEVVYVRQADGTVAKQIVTYSQESSGRVTMQILEDVNQIKRDVADLKRDVAEVKSLLTGVKTSAPAAASPAPVLTTRAAVGHTHTCSKGHTWDHSMDGGSHQCPFCKESQFVQDAPGRRVVYSNGGTSWAEVSSAGCTGSGCSTGFTVQRRGIFGRPRN